MGAEEGIMRTVPNELLEEMTRRLVEELRPERIILFGSHAWGLPQDDSDVDLFVIVPESTEPARVRALRARRALRGLNVPKDVMVRTRAEVERARRVHASLESEVLDRGVVLYRG